MKKRSNVPIIDCFFVLVPCVSPLVQEEETGGGRRGNRRGCFQPTPVIGGPAAEEGGRRKKDSVSSIHVRRQQQAHKKKRKEEMGGSFCVRRCVCERSRVVDEGQRLTETSLPFCWIPVCCCCSFFIGWKRRGALGLRGLRIGNE